MSDDRCPGVAEYSHGMSLITVHDGKCCGLDGQRIDLSHLPPLRNGDSIIFERTVVLSEDS